MNICIEVEVEILQIPGALYVTYVLPSGCAESRPQPRGGLPHERQRRPLQDNQIGYSFEHFLQ